MACERRKMDKHKGKPPMVPMFNAAEFFSGKKDMKPVGWMSNPDEPGPVVLDRKTFESLTGVKIPGAKAPDAS